MKNIFKILLVCLIIISCKDKNADNLVITTENGEVKYTVNNAKEPDELINGLMNVESMPENKGMIFDLRGLTGVAMWMKDTKIPLDMIFINEDTEIVWIHENAEAMSEDLITSPEPFDFVLELNAGQVEKNNIKVGNKIKHSFFNNIDSK